MYFRAISCPRFRAEAASPSLVEGASRMGRQLRRWALAARVTVVSAMPQASLPRERSAQGAAGPSSTGWSWRPSRAAWAASATREKSATREAGFSSGSSCRKGTR